MYAAKQMNREWTSTLAFWCAVLAIGWLFEFWNPPWSDRVNVYWKVCAAPVDNQRCTKFAAGSAIKYFASAQAQTVVELRDESLRALGKCAVFDRDNWNCEWIEMSDSAIKVRQFAGMPSNSLEQVPRWRWLLLRYLSL